MSISVVHALLLARRHREEQLLDAAIVSVVGNFLSSSFAIIMFVMLVQRELLHILLESNELKPFSVIYLIH